MPGQLFTHYFLTDGIKETPEWAASASAIADFRKRLLWAYEPFKAHQNPNEAATEQDLIRPVLEALGWTDYLPQQGAKGNEDIPDHLLFSDAQSKERAAGRTNSQDRYLDALLIEESKRFGLPLDSRDPNDNAKPGSPHAQILRYLATADTVSDGRIRWGILTNGGLWRLYDHRARPRATAFFESNLAEILDSGDQDGLRTFYLLFRRDSFVPQQGDTTSFLNNALAEGRRYEERVAQDLSEAVFKKVFPNLVQALADASDRELPAVREAALTFLYRLLFLLYAEDRGLLPVNDSRYDDYSLRKKVRDSVADRTARGDTFSGVANSYYDDLITLFRLIDKGDASIGLPPYNGGLFASVAAPLLEAVRLPDSVVAPIVYALSHTNTPEGRRFVNYRDMSVQQLGSIYERLLEQEPVRDGAGNIDIRPNPYARKDSGSFFTPQELVDLIIDRTLKPLAEERLRAFEDTSRKLKSDRRPRAERKAELRKLDPAEAILDLKVLDPAMGSGHFLVSAVDFLSDYIAQVIEYAPAVPEWLDGEYESPLVERIAAIRREILHRAGESHWAMDETQLTDQAIIRRMVLKRCIYGVDKNPLTVELAKVSLWLHSFTVGAPLSFLDHHLRCGDSLVGMRVQDAGPELNRLGGLFASSAIAGAENAATGMQLIEEMSDADISEVQESASLFQDVENATANLRGVLDVLSGMRWMTAGLKAKQRTDVESPLVAVLSHEPEQSFNLLATGIDSAGSGPTSDGHSVLPQATEIWTDAKSIADGEGFLHWEATFPGVWRHWQNIAPEGGFDVVIGNPPWDRIKLQEVEWFAARLPEVALESTAAARKTAIQRLRDEEDPLACEFDAAKERADKQGHLVRESGHYPLLGGGDINLYSLFVERAMGLIRPDGLVGLLTPSGIYADKTAADFFESVSTAGRVAGLFDFENKKIFFKEVHASFKFCALILGGEKRQFEETECAFFLHDTETINCSERCFPLEPKDFALVNPNTGTAPVFRTRRDAEITRRIYERHPVLVDRSGEEERRAWPVRYRNMFHMTNDSHLFRTAAQLDADGFYRPVENPNHWRKGEKLYLPLYEGKMVQAFDHRAASVVVNPTNLNRPAQPRDATLAEHANPEWLPSPQFWVGEDVCDWPQGLEWTIAVKHVTAVTNVRTMIATLVPRAGFGNSIPLFLPGDEQGNEILKDGRWMHLLLANLSSFPFDFVTRQKVQGQNLNLFLLEQLPVIPPEDYDRQFGNKTARELVRDHVLRLTYTANDMIPFARDMGYDGPPFIWDEEERRHLRARLDALYFHLYGLSREDAEYVLSTFPIVQREDEKRCGKYRTRDLILAYMNALQAGDTETKVAA